MKNSTTSNTKLDRVKLTMTEEIPLIEGIKEVVQSEIYLLVMDYGWIEQEPFLKEIMKKPSVPEEMIERIESKIVMCYVRRNLNGRVWVFWRGPIVMESQTFRKEYYTIVDRWIFKMWPLTSPANIKHFKTVSIGHRSEKERRLGD
jgi:hypothetical protein